MWKVHIVIKWVLGLGIWMFLKHSKLNRRYQRTQGHWQILEISGGAAELCIAWLCSLCSWLTAGYSFPTDAVFLLHHSTFLLGDKSFALIFTSSHDWQLLYKRSVKSVSWNLLSHEVTQTFFLFINLLIFGLCYWRIW